MKILYVEPYIEAGHRNVNASFLGAIARNALHVDVVTHKECLRRLALPKNAVAHEFPGKLTMHHGGSIRERYSQARLLNHVRTNFNVGSYDAVFLASFDEFSLALSGLRGRLFLLAHGNIAGMKNSLKRFAMSYVGSFAKILVLNDHIRDGALQYGLADVAVEPHGFGPRYSLNNEEVSRHLSVIDARLAAPSAHGIKRILFAPAGAKYNDDFIGEISHCDDFKSLLTASGTLFVAKGAKGAASEGNFVNIRGYIPDEQFAALFLSSAALILSYPMSFEYRVSALLFECFAHDKPCILSDIESFRTYSRHFPYSPFFSDRASFLSQLRGIVTGVIPSHLCDYREKQDLCPTMRSIFA